MELIASDICVSRNRDQELSSKSTSLSTPPTKGTWKLTVEERTHVLDWLGTCVGISEIQKRLESEFGKKVTVSAIKYHKNLPGNKAFIQKSREEWGRDLFLVDLANKRKRLESIEKIYGCCEKRGDHKTALDALNQIRQEVEKDLSSLSMTNYNINVYKDMNETEIEEERIKSLERIKILKSAIKDAVNRKKLENKMGQEDNYGS